MSDEESGTRLLEMANLLTPMALRTAATLKLADHVATGAVTAAELARRTSCVERPLRKVMDHLVTLGVMRREGEGYALEKLGVPLLSEHDALAVRPLLDLNNACGRTEMALTHLMHTVRTGEAAYEGAWGKSVWDDFNERSAWIEGIELFEKNTTAWDAEFVAQGYDWSGVRSVVDVGGSSGALLTSLLQAHPHLYGTLLDLPVFADMGAKNLRAAGLTDRSAVVRGSFFDPLPAGRDVYLLSAVLADWDDEHAVDILRGCARAAGSGGKLLLAEVHLTAPGSSGLSGDSGVALWFEANMGNPDRTVDDLVVLGEAAGLEVTGAPRTTGLRSLIEFGVPC
ncbi:methyltransferase [Streptomyces sp. NPDC001880]